MCIRDSTGIGFFSSELQGRGDDVAVEAAAQTTIGRDQHDGAVFLFLMLGQQRMGSALHLAGKLGQNLAILAGIRPEAFDAVSYTHLDVYKRQAPWRR